MATIKDGAHASVYINGDKGVGDRIGGVVSWSREDSSSFIDTTTAANGAYTSSRPARQSGRITINARFDADDAATPAAVAGGIPVDAYFYIDDSDAAATYAWSVYLTDAVSTGGLTEAATRNLTATLVEELAS